MKRLIPAATQIKSKITPISSIASIPTALPIDPKMIGPIGEKMQSRIPRELKNLRRAESAI